MLGFIGINIGMCIHGLIHFHSTHIRGKLIETGIMDFTIESYLSISIDLILKSSKRKRVEGRLVVSSHEYRYSPSFIFDSRRDDDWSHCVQSGLPLPQFNNFQDFTASVPFRYMVYSLIEATLSSQTHLQCLHRSGDREVH